MQSYTPSGNPQIQVRTCTCTTYMSDIRLVWRALFSSLQTHTDGSSTPTHLRNPSFLFQYTMSSEGVRISNKCNPYTSPFNMLCIISKADKSVTEELHKVRAIYIFVYSCLKDINEDKIVAREAVVLVPQVALVATVALVAWEAVVVLVAQVAIVAPVAVFLIL